MALFLSLLAKALNAIDGVRGVVWERRYSGIPILDEGALVDRIVYSTRVGAPAGAVTPRRCREAPLEERS